MKPSHLFRRVSLFTFGTCVIAGSALGDPEELPDPLDGSGGVHLIPGGASLLRPFVTTAPTTRNNVELSSYDGGIVLYSGRDPSSPSNLDGGIILMAAPVSVVLSSESVNPDAGTFDIWKWTEWGSPTIQPLFRVDGATGNTTFTGSNVAINSGSLSVGGSAVLTAASASSVLTGQNFVQLASGGVLNIVSTTASTSNTTGAITVAGGIGVAKDSYINGVKIGRGTALNSMIMSTNMAIGASSLSSNASGSQNTALGNNALKSATYASYSTAVGANSLQNHVGGNYNTAVGYNTLSASTTSASNTAIGVSALAATTTGTLNSGLGQNALVANTTGGSNTAIGLSAMQANTTGSSNSVLGVGGLYANTTGGSNTVAGYLALGGNSTGSSNVAVGYEAGRYRIGDITPLNNTSSIYIGANTRGLEAADANSIVIGTDGEGKGSNTTVIGNGSTTHTYLKGETNSASLRVAGNTVLEGDVVLEEAQGDISMGDYQ